jgi:hypothetical protein
MEVNELIKEFAPKGVLYLEVSGGENERAALDYKKHYRSGRMLGMDEDYTMMGAYDSQGWPRIVIIDREGSIRFHGFPAGDGLSNIREALSKLVEPDPARLSPGLVLQEGLCYPKYVADAVAAHRDRSPRLALDQTGRPWVAFYSNRAGSNDIYVRRQEADGAFVHELVTTGQADDYAPDCVFDSAGRFWVAWCSDRSGKYDIYVRRHSGGPWPDGTWSEPVQLTHSDDDAMRPRIAAGKSGDLTVTYYKWCKLYGTSRDRNIFARRYDPETGEWSEEVEISPHEPEVEDHTDPDVAIDGDGNSWIVWSYDYHPQLFEKPFDTDQPSVFAVKLARDGTVSPLLLVGTVGQRRTAVDVFPSVTVDTAGKLWCAWDASDLWNGPLRAIRLAELAGEKFGDASDVTEHLERKGCHPERRRGDASRHCRRRN